jgi:hypothetical protein
MKLKQWHSKLTVLAILFIFGTKAAHQVTCNTCSSWGKSESISTLSKITVGIYNAIDEMFNSANWRRRWEQ